MCVTNICIQCGRHCIQQGTSRLEPVLRKLSSEGETGKTPRSTQSSRVDASVFEDVEAKLACEGAKGNHYAESSGNYVPDRSVRHTGLKAGEKSSACSVSQEVRLATC